MASQPPTLPPSALAGAAANAKTDQIAVRIILMPDSARTNEPKHITGTVEGQNPDGTLRVKTDIGELRILLRDKGNLPQGMKIEIDIPAGRNPQQANIRQSDSAPVPSPPLPQTKPAPSLVQAIAEQPDAPIKINPETGKPYIAPQQNPQIAIPTKLQPEILRDMIASQAGAAIDKTALPIPIAAGSVQAGQIVRLLPIPPNSLPQNVMEALAKPLSIPDLISNLVSVIENLPKGETQLRTTLITILSRLDFSVLASLKPPQSSMPTIPITSPLLPPSTPAQATPPITSPLNPAPIATLPNGLPVIPPTGITPSPHTTLIAKIDALVTSIGLPPPFQSPQANPSAQIAPTSLSLFNPSKSVDGQVLAFQNPAPSAVPNFVPLSASVPNNNVTPLHSAPVSPSQVLGFTQNGLPILSVPLPNTGMTQIYSMQFKADNLNAGTPIFIALDPASTKPTQAMFIQSADGSISLDQNLSKTTLNGWINSGTWDSLDDLFQNISHISSTHGQNFAQMMPTPAQPNTMGALSLFFLSMMRTGDTDGWIANEAVSLLRQMGKSDLLRAVTSDMSVASRVDTMALSQDWRMTLLPMFWENQIHKTPLYYKNMPDDGDKDGADDKKRRRLRFLFDLNMSRMGGVQIDGFMQSERLDIILRAKSPFSPPMQTQMKRIYAGAMEKSRLTGELSFQFKPEQWVDLSQTQEKTGLHA